MIYGISYIPVGGAFMGVRCGLMQYYAEAFVFPSYEEADALANVFFSESLRRELQVKIEPSQKIERMVANVVETYSGRLHLVADAEEHVSFQLKNPDRPDYAYLKERMVVERTAREKWQAYMAERLRIREKRAIAVPIKKDRSKGKSK